LHLFSRRTFLKASGAVTAAAVLAPGRLSELAIAADSAGLTPAERATYLALIEAVALVQPGIDPSAANSAVDTFENWCLHGPPELLRVSKTALDGVEGADARSPFSTLSPRGRLDRLHSWLHAARPTASQLPPPDEVVGPAALTEVRQRAMKATIAPGDLSQVVSLAAGQSDHARARLPTFDRDDVRQAALATFACEMALIPYSPTYPQASVGDPEKPPSVLAIAA